MLNLHCQLDAVAACGLHDAMPAVIAQLTDAPFSTALLAGLTFQLCLLWLVSVLVPLGTGDLARPDWDLEWLVTLPSPDQHRAVGARVRAQRGQSGRPAGPAAHHHHDRLVLGPGWLSPLLALAASLVLLLLAAMLRTLVDTGLRLSLAPSKLANLQAMISILCTAAHVCRHVVRHGQRGLRVWLGRRHAGLDRAGHRPA